MSKIDAKLKRTAMALAAAIIVVLSMASAAPVGLISSQAGLIAQFELASQAAMLDRSRKGDRLSSVVPSMATTLPLGCEAPFSSLANFAPSNVVGRCLT